MAMPWFRMYAEAVDDEKLRLLAFEDRWHFVAILCLKSQGTIDSPAPHLERRLALKLGLQLAQLDEVKRRLTEVGLIDANWQPVSWGARQYEHDHSTPRVKRFRERQALKRGETVAETGKNRTEQTEGAQHAQGEESEGAKVWDRLLATDGAERPPKANKALQVIGGWPRVSERKTGEAPILRLRFIEAYRSA